MDAAKVAQQRLKRIHILEATLKLLSGHLEYELYRELQTQLHAACVPDSVQVADRIAHAVAERLTEAPW